MTGGLVSPSWVAMQKCLADRTRAEAVTRTVACPTVKARVSIKPEPFVIEPLFPPPVTKPKITAKAEPRVGTVVSVKDTAAAPPGPSQPTTTTTSKPTVKVKRNGNGNGKRPKLRVKKT